MIKSIFIRRDYLINLPILVSMSLAAGWVWYFHAIAECMPLFLGIIAGALVDMDDRLIGRLRNFFFTLIHFSLAACLVQLTYGHAWAFSLLMVMAAFTTTMVGAIDVRYRTIAFGSLLVMLYTVLTYLPHVPWYTNPLMLICGTSLYHFCAIVVHLASPNRPVQDSLAQAFSQLADYMCIKARFFDPDEAELIDEEEIRLAVCNSAVIQTFNQCRSALFYRLRNQQRNARMLWMMHYYLLLQDIHERISSRHVEYQALTRKLAHSDLLFRIQRLIVLQADACRAISQALQHNRPYIYNEKLSRAGLGLQEAFSLYCQAHADSKNADCLYLQQMIDNLLSISYQLQRLPQLQETIAQAQNIDTRITGQDVDRLQDILPALKAHCTFQSGVLRHAVRLALLAAVSCFIVEFFHLKMGYWILLTGVIVCQPNYSATTTRLKQRITGTLLGVLVGSLAPYFIPTLPGLLLLVVVGTVLFFAFRLRRYSFSTFFITIQVLAGFAIIGMDTQAAMLSRFLDTILGCMLAWCAVSYLWPDWHYLTLGRIGRRALQQDASYLQQVSHQLRCGQQDDVEYRTARRNAYECASILSTMVSDMSGEAGKYGIRLTEARNLLLLNYVLLSSISALGALRGKLNCEQGSRPYQQLAVLLNLSEDVALQMETAADNPLFHTQWHELEMQLAQDRPDRYDGQVVQHVVWAQLKRIHDKLAAYVAILPPAENQSVPAEVQQSAD